MKCHQCGKPAMFSVGKEEVPLCLDCNLKFTQIAQMHIEANERMLNYLSDQADCIIGLPVSGPRFPQRKAIHIGGVNLNNIKIDNSTIGVLNTGNIESVDVSVTSLQQNGNNQLANAIKEITNAVVASNELQAETKNQLIEMLSIISSEATAPAERQRKSVVKVLIDRFKDILSISVQLTQLWNTWGPIIVGAFSS